MLASIALALALAADPAPAAPTQGVVIIPANRDSGALVMVKGNTQLNCRVGVYDKPCFLPLPPGPATLFLNGTVFPISVSEGISWFRLTLAGHGMLAAGLTMLLVGPLGAVVAFAVGLAASWGASTVSVITIVAMAAMWGFIIAAIIAPVLIALDLAIPHEQLEPIEGRHNEPPPANWVPPPVPAA